METPHTRPVLRSLLRWLYSLVRIGHLVQLVQIPLGKITLKNCSVFLRQKALSAFRMIVPHQHSKSLVPLCSQPVAHWLKLLLGLHFLEHFNQKLWCYFYCPRRSSVFFILSTWYLCSKLMKSLVLWSHCLMISSHHCSMSSKTLLQLPSLRYQYAYALLTPPSN